MRWIILNAQMSTIGPQPNTEFIAKSLGSDALTDNGCIKVEPTLQLLKHPEIYAVGDVVDYPEQKQYMKAVNHANIVAANIIASIQNKPLSPYKGSTEMIVITIGKVSIIAVLLSPPRWLIHDLLIIKKERRRGIFQHSVGHRSWRLVLSPC